MRYSLCEVLNFKPGVWLGDLPAITSVPMDNFLGHLEETWLKVELDRSLSPHEVYFPIWFCGQYLVPAELVNRAAIKQISLGEVISIRQKEDNNFNERLLSAVDNLLQPDWGYIQHRELAEYYISEFGAARFYKRFEQNIQNEKYLWWLQEITKYLGPDEVRELIYPRVATAFGGNWTPYIPVKEEVQELHQSPLSGKPQNMDEVIEALQKLLINDL